MGWNGHMMGGGWPWGWWMAGHGIFALLFLALLISGAILLVRAILGRNARSSALDVLRERYARGEIDREEYLRKKRDINGSGAGA